MLSSTGPEPHIPSGQGSHSATLHRVSVFEGSPSYKKRRTRYKPERSSSATLPQSSMPRSGSLEPSDSGNSQGTDALHGSGNWAGAADGLSIVRRLIRLISNYSRKGSTAQPQSHTPKDRRRRIRDRFGCCCSTVGQDVRLCIRVLSTSIQAPRASQTSHSDAYTRKAIRLPTMHQVVQSTGQLSPTPANPQSTRGLCRSPFTQSRRPSQPHQQQGAHQSIIRWAPGDSWTLQVCCRCSEALSTHPVCIALFHTVFCTTHLEETPRPPSGPLQCPQTGRHFRRPLLFRFTHSPSPSTPSGAGVSAPLPRMQEAMLPTLHLWMRNDP